MEPNLNNFLNLLETLLKWSAEAGQPAVKALVMVLIVGLTVWYIVWRVKSELRGLTWSRLTFAQRREIIQKILNEAIELSEWLYSNVNMGDPQAKQKVGKRKAKTAIKYARRELCALGAMKQDLDTLSLRLEHVFAQQHPGKLRFGKTVVSASSGSS